jgi:DNA (cytosine-5)-methyltransferase 1
MEEDMITIEQYASSANMSIKAVRREIASGAIRSVKKNNRYFIDPNEAVSQITLPMPEVMSCSHQEYSDNVNWVDISVDMNTIDGWARAGDRNEFNFIDLFAGAGGLSCGLVMSGFTPVGSVEIAPWAVATYKRNFVQAKQFGEIVETRDIRNPAVKQGLIESVKGKRVHLVAGGFPCQGFSMAGHRIVTDERNSLYREMLSIVRAIMPDFVLMENVEGLRSMLGGRVERQIIDDYAEIGYETNVTTLNAADYSVPQTRRRVIFIANKIGAVNAHPSPILSPSEYKTVKDAIGRFSDMPENAELSHVFTRHSKDITERLKRLPCGSSPYDNYSDAWKRVYWDKPSVTIKENHGGVNVHPLFPRVMTPRELAALQSFPDDFIFEGPKKWQLVQIGNAVPPLLGKAIGLAIAKSLKGETQHLEQGEQQLVLQAFLGGSVFAHSQ